MKSADKLRRFSGDIWRRTHVMRIYANAQSCLRLVRALAIAT